MTGVLGPFLASACRAPDRVAIIDRDGTGVTYVQLQREAAALAADWRRKGLAPGKRALVATPVSITLYRSLIAIWMVGCEAIFPEPSAGLKGLGEACRRLLPDALVSTGLGRLLIPLVTGHRMCRLAGKAVGESDQAPQKPSDVALYSFTSGSTGAPKCIPRSHEFMLAQSRAVSDMLASEKIETDLVWFPIFVLACLANGGTAVLADSALRRPDRPDTAALARQCRRHGVTRLLGPPSMVGALANEPDMPRLTRVFTGGGPVMPDHFEAIARYADEAIAVYGSTEAEPIATLSSRDLTDDMLKAAKSGAGLPAGRPVDDLSVRIEDDEIQVSGLHVVRSYLDPARNAENKIVENEIVWHRTGDGGRFDADGRLWLRGRLKGRIGDHWPLECEMNARSWPGVSAAALTQIEGEPLLAIVGDRRHEQEWRHQARRIGLDVIPLKSLPMDRRHASKLDYSRLEKWAKAASRR